MVFGSFGGHNFVKAKKIGTKCQKERIDQFGVPGVPPPVYPDPLVRLGGGVGHDGKHIPPCRCLTSQWLSEREKKTLSLPNWGRTLVGRSRIRANISSSALCLRYMETQTRKFTIGGLYFFYLFVDK